MPVTASFIIAAVIIAPALVQLGVERSPTAYMFIFYYAVLSEVSPPTALAAVATAAITGGKVMPTMWQAWKYTLPAFLVPFAFVLTDNGAHLLGAGIVRRAWCGRPLVSIARRRRARGGDRRLDRRSGDAGSSGWSACRPRSCCSTSRP